MALTIDHMGFFLAPGRAGRAETDGKPCAAGAGGSCHVPEWPTASHRNQHLASDCKTRVAPFFLPFPAIVRSASQKNEEE